MMILLRWMARSGGTMAVALALAGLAFYGIAQMSVLLVDDPGRGARILAVFLLLSGVFCLLVRWAVRRALAQAMRPIGAAREATSRLVDMGGRGGRHAFRFLGRRTRFAGSAAGVATGAARRLIGRVGAWFPARRGGRSPAESADVIPLRPSRRDREAR